MGTLASPAHIATWCIACAALVGVIVRPWKLPEAIWPALSALALAVLSLVSWSEVATAVLKGSDVYLFLTGMMLLAELARREGLFDWLAAHAVQRARGSPTRLFALIYLVGTLITVFLSNDATAVVLTPAVYAAAKQADAKPLPYLFICAMVANAASFTLPISNPANLVVYGAHMPSLSIWLAQFALPSFVSIGVTFAVLRFTQRHELARSIAREIKLPALLRGGRLAAGGIALAAIVLLIASALNWQLGLPTFLAGAATAATIMLSNRLAPWRILRHISWTVLPLVAGLFVLVAAVERTGVLGPVTLGLPTSAAASPKATALAAGTIVGLLCNLLNNLPLGLLVGTAASTSQVSPQVTGALMIGVDIGPNLSVTGSLATILWLLALRREGQAVSGWRFLKVGYLVMPLALVAALVTFAWQRPP